MTASSLPLPPGKKHVVTTAGSMSGRALADIWRGLLLYRLWGVLGLADIRQQYKRSTLGPLWITLSTAIFVFLLGALYSQLFNRDLAVYLPHLAVGYIIWGVIANFLTGGSAAFINAEGIIKQTVAPLSVHVYRIAWVNLITLAHHVIIFAIIALIFGIQPTAQWLLAIPGLFLIFFTGVGVSLLLGTLSARFRDIPQILQSVVRVLFFFTPVIWQPDLMPRRAIFLNANPFYHYIEVVRAPLLNKPIDPLHWQFAAGIAIVSWLMAILVYRRFRQRVPYWV